MLDFEHVHLGLAPNNLGGSRFLILADPVFRVVHEEDTGFRKG